MRTPISAPLRSIVLLAGTLLPMAPIALSAATVQAAASVQLDGTWQGAVRQPNGKDNRWVVKIEKAATGWKGTMWFIDQKSPAIPIDKVAISDGTVTLAIERAFITYEGKMSPDGNTITGTRTQADDKQPLVFVRATPETAWAIPEPPPPMPKMDPNAKPGIEVATIKPQAPDDKGFAFLLNNGKFIGKGLTLQKLMTISMTLNAAQIAGLPDWATQEKYDIDAKPDTPGQPSLKQFMGEVQSLMTDRFGLKYHIEKRTMTAYSLTVKGAIKMKPAPTGNGDIPGFGLPPGRLIIANATMEEFCGFLQANLFDHPVVDQTNLAGTRYGGTLKYQMDDEQAMKMGMQKAPPPPDSGDVPPPLITALGEEFGLKLESAKIPVDVIVIDSVTRPTPN